MPQAQLLEGAEEFRLGGGPVGALLVHGLTGSPQSLRTLGEYLAERGVAVEALRLPGHGTTWQDLNRATAADWSGAVESAFESFTSEHEEVFVVALSFGAALALDLAARNPGRIKGMVTLGGFLHTRDPRRFFAPVIKRIVRSLPGVANDIADPDGKEVAYDRLPTAAAHAMLGYIKRARAALPHVTCPLLVMHGRNDHTVGPYNAGLIYRSVRSADKQLVWCERSYHVITLDYDRHDVYRRTFEFIKERSTHAL